MAIKPPNLINQAAGAAQNAAQGAGQDLQRLAGELLGKARSLAGEVTSWRQQVTQMRTGIEPRLQNWDNWVRSVETTSGEILRKLPNPVRVAQPTGQQAARRPNMVVSTGLTNVPIPVPNIDPFWQQLRPRIETLARQADAMRPEFDRVKDRVEQLQRGGEALKARGDAIAAELRRSGLNAIGAAREATDLALRTLADLAQSLQVVTIVMTILAIIIASLLIAIVGVAGVTAVILVLITVNVIKTLLAWAPNVQALAAWAPHMPSPPGEAVAKTREAAGDMQSAAAEARRRYSDARNRLR